MAETRRDPGPERREALRCAAYAVVFAALAIALLTLARSWWPQEWTEPDEETRDRVVAITSLALGGLAAWWLLWAIVRTLRWLRARHWERMLDRPAEAHLVPPLATHLLPKRRGAVLVVAGLAVVGVGLVVYGVLALDDRAPRLRNDGGEDHTSSLLIAGVVCLVVAFVARKAVRAARAAREVEDRSNRPLARVSTSLPPPAERTAASVVPHLDVEFVERSGQLDHSELQAARGGSDRPLHIIYLRLFDNVAGTQRFVAGRWRRIGYVHLLESADQVTPEELAAAKDAGSVDSLFIASEAELDDALRRQATGKYDRPMPEGLVARWRWMRDAERGRYPLRGLLCHGSFWHRAVDLLLVRMDVVVIDLTGYVPANAGTQYELQRAIDRCPARQIRLLADGTSDRRFLAAQIRSTWSTMAAGSPNAGPGERTMTVFVGPT